MFTRRAALGRCRQQGDGLLGAACFPDPTGHHSPRHAGHTGRWRSARGAGHDLIDEDKRALIEYTKYF
jgi:hypothetical protein